MGADRHAAFKLISVLIGVTVALLIGETALRVRAAVTGRDPAEELQRTATSLPPPVAPGCPRSASASLGQLVRPSLDPGVVYELKPSIEACFSGAYVRTTTDGLRTGRPVIQPKPADLYRILLLGDSQTFGWGVAYEDTFAAVLEREMAAETGHAVEVVNAGVPGYNTAQEAAFLERRGLSFTPDCVLVLFINNDFGLPYLMLERPALGSRRSYLWAAVQAALRPARYRTEWRMAEGDTATTVSDADLERVPPAYRGMVGLSGYERALRSMAAAVSRAGIPLIDFADYDGLPREVGEKLHRLHVELGLWHPEFHYPLKESFRLSPDDPHFSADGHRHAARRMLDALRAMGVCLPKTKVAPSFR